MVENISICIYVVSLNQNAFRFGAGVYGNLQAGIAHDAARVVGSVANVRDYIKVAIRSLANRQDLATAAQNIDCNPNAAAWHT